MKISRAGFLKACGAAIIGASLPGWRLFETYAAAWSPAGPETSASLFHPHVGTTFAIDGVSQRVRLAEVIEQPLHEHIEQFSLLFHAPAADSTAHGTYTFRHAALGKIDMFITPVGAPSGTIVYQACFSRFLTEDVRCPISS